MRQIYDVIIVGSGIAGLTAAIYLKEAGLDVVVISKNKTATENNTSRAQGGIIAWKNQDDPEVLKKDLLQAGSCYNYAEAVDYFAKEGPRFAYDFLINKIGIQFSTDIEGKLDYTEEAAHSTRRIIHYRDETGKKIEDELYSYAQKINVMFQLDMTAIDIITNNHHSVDCQEYYKERIAMGLYVLDNITGEVKTWLSHKIILATGGLGNLYQHTTNDESATGDGLSMAYRAGANIINSEFVQFHPTSLYHRDIKRFLITEAIRGEGAKILDPRGNEFLSKYTSKKELDSRDVVARAIFNEMANIGSEYMLLDIAHNYKGKIPLKDRFSKIYETCLSGGIDITKENIPIVPAAHYFCGGIRVDLSGQSSIKNLYALGEVSCTGVHGANRLASSSLLEAVLWAYNSSHIIIDSLKNKNKKITIKRFDAIPDWNIPKEITQFDPVLINHDLNFIQKIMWNYAGIIRTKKGLERARADLNYHEHRIFSFYKEAKLDKKIIELRNAVVSAKIIVESALHNKKSIGCHFIQG